MVVSWLRKANKIKPTFDRISPFVAKILGSILSESLPNNGAIDERNAVTTNRDIPQA
jgi:hypothetical protein